MKFAHVLLFFAIVVSSAPTRVSAQSVQTGRWTASPRTGPDAVALARWLSANALPPEQFVAGMFDRYDVVLMGEDHCIRQNLQFTASLIPTLYEKGVRNLVMEFGASEDQARMDSLVTAPVYDEQAARDMMFDYNVGWAYTEYIQMPRAAWEFNRSLPPGSKPFRIVNMSYIYDWDGFKGERTPEAMNRIFHKGPIDEFRANLIASEILDRGEKAAVLTGTPHAFTHFLPAVTKGLSDTIDHFDTTWLGTLLLKKFPGRIGNVVLHYPFDGKVNGSFALVQPAGGLLETAFAMNDNRPVGFMLDGTLAGEVGDNSSYSIGYPGFNLGMFADAYVFLVPIASQTGCHIDTAFFNGKPWPQIRRNLPDPDWHGDVKSLDEHWKIIKKYTDVHDRYSHVNSR